MPHTRCTLFFAAVLAVIAFASPRIPAAEEFQREMTIANLTTDRTLLKFIQSDTEAEDESPLSLEPCGKTNARVFRMNDATVQFQYSDGENSGWCIFKKVDLRPAYGIAFGMVGDDGDQPVLTLLSKTGKKFEAYKGRISQSHDDSFGAEGSVYVGDFGNAPRG